MMKYHKMPVPRWEIWERIVFGGDGPPIVKSANNTPAIGCDGGRVMQKMFFSFKLGT